MRNIKRNDFMKMGALFIAAPLYNNSIIPTLTDNTDNRVLQEDEILNRLVIANDKQVASLLQSIKPGSINFTRKIGYDFSSLAAAYCSPTSKYYHSSLIVPKLEILTEVLESVQTADGTVNIGNLESPPDTAFLVELLCAGAFILLKENSSELAGVNGEIKKFLIKAGDALTVGGVHTPNHRWVVSAALARLNSLYPNKKHLNRINEWLSEGVYMDSDGHYPERSATYSDVENNALITIARLTKKPELYEKVRKNLEMTYYYMEPNGELVTTDSRRQDQYMSKSIVTYYLHYRYMAIHDNNKQFAAIVRMIENLEEFEKEVLDKDLFQFMENLLLQKALPPGTALSDNFEKLFTTSHLLRIRRGNTTSTLFGGVDWPLTIASGRSNSPNFFSYRKGKAVLKYMRLSSNFFSMGYFYSEGIKKDGNKYVLYKKLTVPYYQPLPPEKRNSEGDYKLSPSTDGRFWNKMDFNNRPVSNVKNLETSIVFAETDGKVELDIHVAGLTGVPVIIELCFFEGGKLSGVTEGNNENRFLENGTGSYEFGGDTIQFGPGIVAHKNINSLEGERYSTHFGSLRTNGMHVYLTGITPFNHKLTFN